MSNQRHRDAIRAYMKEHGVNYTTARREILTTTPERASAAENPTGRRPHSADAAVNAAVHYDPEQRPPGAVWTFPDAPTMRFSVPMSRKEYDRLATSPEGFAEALGRTKAHKQAAAGETPRPGLRHGHIYRRGDRVRIEPQDILEELANRHGVIADSLAKSTGVRLDDDTEELVYVVDVEGLGERHIGTGWLRREDQNG